MSFVFTAMLCKEQGITATAVCVFYEIFVVQKVNLTCEITVVNIKQLLQLVYLITCWLGKSNGYLLDVKGSFWWEKDIAHLVQ